MRSVFDQYKQPENQLTHALSCALNEDRSLLKKFVTEIASFKPPNMKRLQILEQQVPGEIMIYSEEEAEKRLPDAWIHDGGGIWTLLIESKVKAPIEKEQLQGHYQVAKRHGFSDIHILVLCIKKPLFNLSYTEFCTWTEIYKWLKKQRKSDWARRSAQYMEIWEARMTENGYLTEGAITEFSGIPFGKEEPYNYPEAKRLLKLAMDALRNCKELETHLQMNPSGKGRGAITGQLGKSVWDLLPIKGMKEGETFTKFPHLTLALDHERILVILVIPSSIRPIFRRNIISLGFDRFFQLMSEVNQNLRQSLTGATGAAPWVIVQQRRYPSQKSDAIIDAILQYDLRTAFPDDENKKGVKKQSEWIKITYEALEHKKSNLQVSIGAIFPYRDCTIQQNTDILHYIAKTWLACEPILKVMIKSDL